MRLRSLVSWCLCLTALGGAPARAAAPDFHYRVWTNEDGLPAIAVRDVAQTDDGYLWIATLDGEDATLFVLRFVEGLSNQELADLFQLEKNNVAVRLHRIRLRLQSEMER